MVLEIADFTVQQGTEEQFAHAVREGLRYASETPGFRHARLTRSAETPTRFVLLIEWDTIEAHTVGFRQSENFVRWRKLISPYFAGDPRVEHFADVV